MQDKEHIQTSRQEAGPARGLLGNLSHRRVLPCAALSEFLEHFWYVNWALADGELREQENLPHPNLHIVIDRQAGSGIFGIQERRFKYSMRGKGEVLGAKFRAGAFSVFASGPLGGLKNQTVPCEQFFPVTSEELDAVLRNDGVEAGISTIERMLLAQAPQLTPSAALAGQLVASIERDSSIISVEQLASRSGYGVRYVQRLFTHCVGASPKWVIERYRLIEALEVLKADKTVSIVSLAQRLGYFDQAHFSKAFRKLIGRTPSDFQKTLA